MSGTTPKPSKAWLIALPLAAATAVGGLWSFTKGTDERRPAPVANPTAGAAAPSPSASVALQLTDLPAGFQRCSFAGEINAYIDHFNRVDPPSAEEIRNTWKQLQDKGATDGYYASYANSTGTCDTMQGGGMSDGPSGQHESINGRPPSTAFTFVVAYRDAAAAASVYQADVFGQSQMKDKAFEVSQGDPSGLGPNSMVGTSRPPAALLRQAIWQRNAFTVYFGSESLQPAESQAAITSVDRRMG